MGTPVEFGIKIILDGSKAAADGIDQITQANTRLSTSTEAVGRAMSQGGSKVASQYSGLSVAAKESEEASKSFLAALQREIDQFGRSRGEIERYNAAQRGLSMESRKKAQALGEAIDAMRRDEDAARSMAAAQDKATAAADQFLHKLREQVATLGMNTQQLQAHKAAQLGVSDAAAPLIAKLGEAGAGAHSAGKHIEGLNFRTVAARRELLVLAHELSQGNYQKFGGSMMVLGEQTGAASLLFSAAGLTALAFAAAIAVVTYAAIKGASSQKQMADGLILTGNYAGETSDSLNKLAHDAVALGGSIGESKKAVAELAASGKYTGEQIGLIASAVVALEHATGKSVAKTIKEFETLAVQSTRHTARSSDAISRATIKLDDQYHFLTLAIYDQIRALEREGDVKGASAAATVAFAHTTKERAEQIIGNLGSVARAWHGIKEAIGGAIDSIGNYGKKSTAASEVERLTKALAQPNMLPGVHNAQTRNAAVALATQQLTVAQAALTAENKKAAAQQAEALTQSEGVHAAQRVDAMLLGAQRKTQGELTVALKEYHSEIEKIAKANPADGRITAAAIAAGEAAITKAHVAALKGNDDRARLLQDALLKEQTSLDREKAIHESRDAMLALFHTKFGLSDANFYAGREAARAEYIASEAASYQKEAALIRGFKPKNSEEVAANKVKYDTMERQHAQFLDTMQAARLVDQTNQLAASVTIAAASDDAINKHLSSLDAEARKLEESNVGREQSRAAVERETVARYDLAIAYQNQFIAEQSAAGATKAELEQAPKILKMLEDQRAAHLRLAKGFDQSDVDAASKVAADQAIKDWKHAGKEIAESLSSAFGRAGSALGAMLKTYADGVASQLEANKRLRDSTKGMSADDPRAIAAVAQARHDASERQIRSYGDIAGAAKGFFKEQSKGYQAMQAAEKVFRAAELAMSIENAVVKSGLLATFTGLFVASKATETAATVASVAPDVAASTAKGTAAAAAGVANQAAGDPYTAWIRMAAMAAAMAALGFAVAGGGGSGADLSKKRQAAAGTGSVLGDATAKSNSIARSIDLVASNSSIELSHTAGMLAALRSIETGISGLGSLVGRQTGLYNGKVPNIHTGTAVSGGTTALAASAIAGGIGGASAGAYYGMAAGSVGGPIGMAIGAVIGAAIGYIASKLTNIKTNIADQGITFDSSKLGQVMDSGVTGRAYADVNTKKSFLGITYSNNTDRAMDGLSSEVTQQFTLVVKSLAAGVSSAASILGVQGDEFTKKLQSFVVDIGSISMKGLTGEEIQKQFEAIFSKLGDDMAKFGVEGLSQFQQVGEGYMETLTRVAANYANLDSILGSVGKTFSTVGLQSIAAREDFISASGGIDNLAKTTSDFAKTYMTDAERLAPVAKYVSEQMNALGLSSVTTRKQFASTALGIDVATEAGARQFAGMMALEAAFAQVHNETEEAIEILELQARVYAATGDKAGAAAILEQQHTAALRTLAPALVTATQAAWAAEAAETARSEAASEASTILDLQAQVYAANGDKVGAATVLAQQHTAALIGLTPAVAAATQAAWTAQAAETARTTALSEASKILDLQGQMYAANGNKAGAAAVLAKQHAAALVGLTPAVVAATKATWAAQAAETSRAEALAEASKILELQGQMYAAAGDKAGQAAVLEKQHTAALVGLTPALAAATRAAWAAQAAEKARAEALSETSKLLDLQGQMYEATGDKAGAAAVLEQQHAAALVGLTPALAAATQATWAAVAAHDVQAQARAIEIDVLTASGKAVEALALQRKGEMDGVYAANTAMKTYLYALQDQKTALETYKTAATAFTAAQASVKTSLQSIGDAVAGFASKVTNAQKAVGGARDAISQGLFSAQDEAAAAQQKIVDLMHESAKATRDFGSSVSDYLQTLRTGDTGSASTQQQLAALRSQLRATAAAASADDTKARSQVVSIAQQLLATSKAKSVSNFGFRDDEGMVKALLGGLAAAAGEQAGPLSAALDPMAVAQKELLAAQEKLAGFAQAASVSGASTDRSTMSIAGSSSALLSAYFTAQSAAAIAQSEYEEALRITQGLALTTTDSMTGLRNSVAEHNVAVAAMAKAAADLASATTGLAAARAAVTVAAPAAAAPAAAAQVGAAASASSLDLFKAEVRSSASYSAATEAAGGYQQYYDAWLKGSSIHGSHANGLDYVPFDGYRAELHKGEEVLTAGAAQRRRDGADLSELILEIRDLKTASTRDIEQMSEELNAGLFSIAKSNLAIEEYLEGAARGKKPFATKVVA